MRMGRIEFRWHYESAVSLVMIVRERVRGYAFIERIKRGKG